MYNYHPTGVIFYASLAVSDRYSCILEATEICWDEGRLKKKKMGGKKHDFSVYPIEAAQLLQKVAFFQSGRWRYYIAFGTFYRQQEATSHNKKNR